MVPGAMIPELRYKVQTPTPTGQYHSAAANTAAKRAIKCGTTTGAAADMSALQASDDAAAPTQLAAMRAFGSMEVVVVESASFQGAFLRAYRLRARGPPQLWVLFPGQAVVQPLLGPSTLALSAACPAQHSEPP